MRLLLLAGLGCTVATLAQVPEDGLTSRELGIRHRLPESRDEQIARGLEIYEYWCSACHGPEPIKPGTAALQAKYQGALPAALSERNEMTPAFVKLIVRQGISMMPFFRPTEISESDLEALTIYLTRNNGA